MPRRQSIKGAVGGACVGAEHHLGAAQQLASRLELPLRELLPQELDLLSRGAPRAAFGGRGRRLLPRSAEVTADVGNDRAALGTREPRLERSALFVQIGARLGRDWGEIGARGNGASDVVCVCGNRWECDIWAEMTGETCVRLVCDW